MHTYDGLIIRPPSEASSLILQATVGCSHNRCTFCPAYKQKKFRIKSTEEIFRDIDSLSAAYGKGIRRVFICDGDPLCMSLETLSSVCDYLSGAFPLLRRIGMYANAGNILKKSVGDLAFLRNKKLSILYMGLESGAPEVLKRVCKGATPDMMIEAATRVKEAGITLNVTALLGLGGIDMSEQHAVHTARVISEMNPDHFALLTLMLVDHTPLHDAWKKGTFVLPDKFQLLKEMRSILDKSRLENTVFYSNHASNYFPATGRLSRDRDKLTAALDSILSTNDERHLRDEESRAL